MTEDQIKVGDVVIVTKYPAQEPWTRGGNVPYTGEHLKYVQTGGKDYYGNGMCGEFSRVNGEFDVRWPLSCVELLHDHKIIAIDKKKVDWLKTIKDAVGR